MGCIYFDCFSNLYKLRGKIIDGLDVGGEEGSFGCIKGF